MFQAAALPPRERGTRGRNTDKVDLRGTEWRLAVAPTTMRVA